MPFPLMIAKSRICDYGWYGMMHRVVQYERICQVCPSFLGLTEMQMWKRKVSSAAPSCFLKRLDSRDWLAPNEVLKVFRGLRDCDDIVLAFEKVKVRKDYKPTEALYNLMIDKLGYASKFDEINNLLDGLKHENCKLSDEFFYRLIKLYINVANHPERAIRTLLSMPEYKCWPTVKTLNLVLNMLVNGKHYEMIRDIYLCAPRLGISVDTCCFNILMKGLCNMGKLDDAFSLLAEIPKQHCKPNATTFGTIMHALCRVGRVVDALQLCDRMQNEGVEPDTVIFNVLISGLCKQGKMDEGLDLLEKMKLTGCHPNAGSYQVLLYGFLTSKRFLDARNFMKQMISRGYKPSFLSYKLLLEGLCSEKLLDDADFILKHMVSQGFIPRMGTWKKILINMPLHTECYLLEA